MKLTKEQKKEILQRALRLYKNKLSFSNLLGFSEIQKISNRIKRLKLSLKNI